MNTIIGYYSTKFGELWDKSLDNLIQEAIEGVLSATKLEKRQIDAIFFGNMLGGIVENSLLLSAHVAELIDVHIPVYRAEAACASGGMAFHMAHEYLKANPNKTVIVLGAEKMTDISAEEVMFALSAAAAEEEQQAGLTFPALYAMMAQVYLKTYGYTEEHLAYISIKNHFHGTMNKNAHFQRTITMEQALGSSYVAYPLKVLDSSPISDGAAALVVTNNPQLNSATKVNILASEVATDSVSLAKRANLIELEATKIAGEKAFHTAGLSQKDISIMEVHDCFSIAEIFALEDLGFWKKGEGGERAKEMSTCFGVGSNLIVNTSGGLKACGHPVGSTGIKQLGEIFLQLTGQAEARQVKTPKYGLAHNVGGSGGVAVVSVLGN